MRPYDVAVTANDGVRVSLFPCFVGEQRRVNAAEHYPGAAGARHLADRVAAQRIPGVNADAYDFSW
jgi:hypothetical protein